jgi:general stress protein 26
VLAHPYPEEIFVRPTTEEFDSQYSDPAATATPWDAAEARLATAEVAWVVTVRPDGRPHSTPMVPVVRDGRVYFHTGKGEVKYANLMANPNVLILAGDTSWDEGLDVAVEGTASPVSDDQLLQQLAELYLTRWDGRWKLDSRDGALVSEPGFEVVMFEVTPTKVFGHDKGDPFSQTTYRYERV